MIKYYKCKFLTDVVLQASSNTQGNIALSDFIAGSNFLGMVAKNYAGFEEKSFEVFHSGAVRFGDGHIVVNNQLSYKIPLSYFNLKLDEKAYFNRMHLSEEEETSLRNEQKQLKQIRIGFMNSSFEYGSLSYTYAQKSKHSKKYRRSEDEGMFGYSSLKKGYEWIFKVTYKDEKLISDVEKVLLGKQRLGKSKSVQYGQVMIESMESMNVVETFIPDNNFTYLYLNSRMALVDAFGNPMLTPSIENLGLTSGQIVWEKTQVRSSSYSPYNYTRQTKEYTRVVIEKGSVIVLKNISEHDKKSLKNGIGAFLNEGFGEVIVNPKFLEIKEPKLQEVKVSTNIESSSEKVDEVLMEFLKAKEEQEEDSFAVASEVQAVYKSLLGASKSQWGEIRSLATSSSKDNLITNVEKFISDGVAKKQWEGNTLLEEIKKSSQPIAFTKLVSKMCREHTKGEENEWL